MADAPLACSGDSTRDGVESSRAVASTADKLRTLADWLDAHPSAVVHQVGFIDVGATGMATVHSFAARSLDDIHKRTAELGGEWEFLANEREFTGTRVIAPGLRFQFFLSRPKAEDLAA